MGEWLPACSLSCLRLAEHLGGAAEAAAGYGIRGDESVDVLAAEEILVEVAA